MPQPVNATGRSPSSLKTLLRGLDVLALFSGQPEWTQTAIAEATGLPLPTVYRLCSTLAGAGFLEREQGGHRFRCGPALLGLAGRALSSLGSPDAVTHALENLAKATGETANLGILVGGEVVYLQSVPGSRLLQHQVSPGSRAPAYCTAIGKSLLAELDDAQARRAVGSEPYPARTQHTLTTWPALSAAIARSRADGVAESNQEYELGLYSLATAVQLAAGRPSAISVSPPISRATAADRRHVAAELRRARADIADVAGGDRWASRLG